MTQTFISKGALVAGTLADNDIGQAHFVRITATAGTNTITVKEEGGGTTLGTFYLHAAGDTGIVEKGPTDELTSSGNVQASAVGSPRS